MKCSFTPTKEEAKGKETPNELLKSFKIVVDKNRYKVSKCQICNVLKTKIKAIVQKFVVNSTIEANNQSL
jgi:hypothetical protein